MIKAHYTPYELRFRIPARTSRNTLETKKLYLLRLRNTEGLSGLGEVSPFEGLSLDDYPDFEDRLRHIILQINEGVPLKELDLEPLPSVQFGLEMALLDLENGGQRIYFPGPFSEGKLGIAINGLIWMADAENMLQQVQDKIAQGYRCIKLKIGALDFDEECRLLETIRKKYNAFQIELRVDANGAFKPEHALQQLKELSTFEIHSIEQPIAAKQWDEMERLCRLSPLPIALDEELLGVNPLKEGQAMLQQIRPQYLILKPGLLGGFEKSTQWIELARKNNTPWWITSALESNLGLASIAQYTATWANPLPQGLGTGQLYTNNFASPLLIDKAHLIQSEVADWDDFKLS